MTIKASPGNLLLHSSMLAARSENNACSLHLSGESNGGPTSGSQNLSHFIYTFMLLSAVDPFPLVHRAAFTSTSPLFLFVFIMLLIIKF